MGIRDVSQQSFLNFFYFSFVVGPSHLGHTSAWYCAGITLGKTKSTSYGTVDQRLYQWPMLLLLLARECTMTALANEETMFVRLSVSTIA